MYQHGKTEELIGEIFNDSKSQLDINKFNISSKINCFPDYNKSLSIENCKTQIDLILNSLQLNNIEILYLHSPDHNIPIEDTLAAVS